MEQAKPLTPVIESKELIVQADDLLNEALMLKITNDELYAIAGSLVKDSKIIQKNVMDYFEPSRAAAEKTKKAILAARNKQLSPAVKAEGIAKNKRAVYRTQQSMLKQIEAAKIQAELHKQREDELLKEAEETGSEEVLEKVDKIFNPKINIPSVPKEEGVSYIENWGYEVIDFKLLPDKYKIEDSKKLQKIVSALKNDCAIPGVKVFQKHSTERVSI